MSGLVWSCFYPLFWTPLVRITSQVILARPASHGLMCYLQHLPTFFLIFNPASFMHGKVGESYMFVSCHILFNYIYIYIYTLFLLVCMITGPTVLWQVASVTFDLLLLLVLGSYLIVLFSFLVITTRVRFLFSLSLSLYLSMWVCMCFFNLNSVNIFFKNWLLITLLFV